MNNTKFICKGTSSFSTYDDIEPIVLEPYFAQLEEDFLQLKQPIEITNYIGGGGYGHVFKAKAGKREIALKVMKPDLLNSDDKELSKEHEGRFVKECFFHFLLTDLLKKRIVNLYSYGICPGKNSDHRYMSMELMKKGSLREVIRNFRDYSLKDRIEIMIDVAKALAGLHAHEFIHRDVKPENILFSEQTHEMVGERTMEFHGERRIKLADLGLIHWVRDKDDSTMIIGSPNYMSPEQINAPDTVDERTDIFSFGVVLFELVNGEYPRAVDCVENIENRMEYLSTLASTPSSGIKKINPGVKDLDPIVRKCLRRNRKNRYQKMHNVLSDLIDYYNNAVAQQLFKS